MAVNPITKVLRARKLGVLIKDARLSSGRSIAQCAGILGITEQQYLECESGAFSLSLPQLEILAYDLNVPLEHFWGDRTRSNGQTPGQTLDVLSLTRLRRKMIATMLKQARQESGLDIGEAAKLAGMDAESLNVYEQGEREIPLPELESLCTVYERPVRGFWDKNGPVGRWSGEDRELNAYKQLPDELRNFVSRPVNRPYIELAHRLSEMSVEKLRAVAEGLLEITL